MSALLTIGTTTSSARSVALVSSARKVPHRPTQLRGITLPHSRTTHQLLSKVGTWAVAMVLGKSCWVVQHSPFKMLNTSESQRTTATRFWKATTSFYRIGAHTVFRIQPRTNPPSTAPAVAQELLTHSSFHRTTSSVPSRQRHGWTSTRVSRPRSFSST